MKNNPQSPPNPSTRAPEEDANSVLPAVPTDANKAYCVAVKLRSTSREINATKATVANAAAKSSNITAKAKRVFDGPTQASIENKMFVAAIAIPAIINVLKIPDLMAMAPPMRVNTMVVIQPNAFEKIAISPFEKPISL